MARRAGTGTVAKKVDLFAEGHALYREMLSGQALIPDTPWEPVRIGPSWQVDPETGGWLLPERTLGWDALAWCHAYLKAEDDGPWTHTPEQARILLWWYALNPDGSFVYSNGVLQRLKGWGKDPFAATLSAIELVGPCRWGGWADDGITPIPVDKPAAWIQIAAVAQSQTENTMGVFPYLWTDEARALYGVQDGKERIWADRSTRHIDACTSSPRVLEGGRPTFVIANETHHWLATNDGHSMDRAMRRNAAKAKDGGARQLAITNAYLPSEDSVAEKRREHMEKVWAGRTKDVGWFYDSLEAPPDAPLTAEAAESVVLSVRGDSTWLKPKSVLNDLLDSETPPSEARRFWYNQIVAAEDAWITKQQWELNESEARPQPGDEIAMFFDGSKSDDTTALVGCRVSDGLVWTIGTWGKPAGWDEKSQGKWIVPRGDVASAVREANDTYRVSAFFCDPGSGDDDETGELFWLPLIDEWSTWFTKLRLEASTGVRRHKLVWDMRAGANQSLFVEATGQALADILAGNLPHTGDRAMRGHVLNARIRPTKYGKSIGKETRNSKRKIDLAVAMIGARMARRRLLHSPDAKRRHAPGKGRVVVLS